MVLILLVAFTSFGITELRGNRRAHKFWMIGTMIGLFGAGLGALWPGRMIPTSLASLF